ncbi:MAG: PRC-barrel domain-containing protein [Candidatus Peregrinibacteria bacterium]|nr:PRC-barrel domain-containing protein [Candidatus Peregrinibacteria bacterium]
MITTFNREIKKWIFARTGESPEVPVARVLDFIISPETGKFKALWVITPNGVRLISTKDVVQWTEKEIVIASENEIVTPENSPKLVKFATKEVSILGAKVFLKNSRGKYLGRVRDFAFDTISPQILSIHVRNGVWVFGKKRIIPRAKIAKISKLGIFITENIAAKKVFEEGKKILSEKKKVPDFED